MVTIRTKVSLLLACCLWASLSSAATLRQLTAPPFITDIKISPTGEYLAIRIFDEGKHHIRFIERETLEQSGGISFPGNNEVGDYYWVNDERVVTEVREFSGTDNSPKYYGELFAANFDGKKDKLIFGYRSGQRGIGSHIEADEAEYAWAEIIDVLPANKKKILISSTTMSKSFGQPAEAMLIDTYSGKESKRIKISAYPGGTFYTDKDGEIRLVTSHRRDRSLHLQALPLDSEEWTDIPESQYGNYFTPVTITADKKSVYILDNIDSDKVGLHKLSLDGESYKGIYTHEDVDITHPVKSTDGRSVYGLRVDNGYPSYLSFSKSGEAGTFKSLLQYFSGSMVSIRSRSRDGRFWIIRIGTDVDAGSYHLFDSESSSIRKLFDSRPDVKTDALAQMEPIEFQSFDGMKINGYFTAARDSSGKTTPPLVVLVHGGPIARDYWGYDAEVQALATNGFSVLQVNYRGSQGYGLQFEAAGYRHWGDNIQKDIIAGAHWAIEQERANEGNICIMGGSFGAYSALQSSILAPELFSCAVANAGIYDLSLMYRKGDIETRYGGEAYLEKVIGRDKDELERFSPVNRIAELRAPVFIAHGKRDQRAPFEHAKRLKDRLDKHQKSYEWFVKRDEAHGFYDNDNKVDYLEAAIAFLNKHLTKPEG